MALEANTVAEPAGENESVPSRTEVWKMFDRIAHRYDFLNRFLSAGQDVSWRKKMAKHLPEGEGLYLLDLATGTADQILFFLKASKRISKADGMDLSVGMLDHGREKIQKLGLDGTITLSEGNTIDIPAKEQTYDVASISFGIRNVTDVHQGLSEMFRVLKPGGRALILECSLPENALVRKGYLFYFRHVLPKIGGIVSGDSYAYNYLNKTVESFPCGQAFCDLMSAAGFSEVKAHPLTLGIATIYQGDRPDQGERADQGARADQGEQL